MRHFWSHRGRTWPLVVLLAVALMVATPLAFLVLGSFSTADIPGQYSLATLGLDNYRQVWLDPETYRVFGDTMIYVGECRHLQHCRRQPPGVAGRAHQHAGQNLDLCRRADDAGDARHASGHRLDSAALAPHRVRQFRAQGDFRLHHSSLQCLHHAGDDPGRGSATGADSLPDARPAAALDGPDARRSGLHVWRASHVDHAQGHVAPDAARHPRRGHLSGHDGSGSFRSSGHPWSARARPMSSRPRSTPPCIPRWELRHTASPIRLRSSTSSLRLPRSISIRA